MRDAKSKHTIALKAGKLRVVETKPVPIITDEAYQNKLKYLIVALNAVQDGIIAATYDNTKADRSHAIQTVNDDLEELLDEVRDLLEEVKSA